MVGVAGGAVVITGSASVVEGERIVGTTKHDGDGDVPAPG
jgi:hypothetical protein